MQDSSLEAKEERSWLTASLWPREQGQTPDLQNCMTDSGRCFQPLKLGAFVRGLGDSFSFVMGMSGAGVKADGKVAATQA